MIKKLQLILALALVLIFILKGAGLAAGPTPEQKCAMAGFDNPAQLAAMVAKLKKAVKNGDKAAVAAMVHYPLKFEVSGDVRYIENQEEFIKSYGTIMNKHVQNAVLQYQKLEDFFVSTNGGWLQDSTGKSQIWVSESKITEIVHMN